MVGIFPRRGARLRPIGILLVEMHEDWLGEEKAFEERPAEESATNARRFRPLTRLLVSPACVALSRPVQATRMVSPRPVELEENSHSRLDTGAKLTSR